MNIEPNFIEPILVEGRAIEGKFIDPDWTAKGEQRASVPLGKLETLWINTGTLCNITCASCYIESSPSNDRLAYITAAEASAFLDETIALQLGTREIGFTGGEPFMNPQILKMVDDALSRGFDVLVLTNAMQPMQRPAIKKGLLALKQRFGAKLKLRVSLDHHSEAVHEAERGKDTWKKALAGLDWLAAQGFNVAIAGRSRWAESHDEALAGYSALFAARGWPIAASDPGAADDVAGNGREGGSPRNHDALLDDPRQEPDGNDVRVEPDGGEAQGRRASQPCCRAPCSPISRHSKWGPRWQQSLEADGGMFSDGAVKLCHPHCAKFCVLGGGSCSA